MQQQDKFNREEAAILAIALAVAGTLSILNQMLPLWTSGVSLAAILHAAPLLLVAVALILAIAEERTWSSANAAEQKAGKYGR